MRIFAAVLALVAALSSGTAYAQSQQPIVGIYEMTDLADTGKTDTFSTMIETAIAGSGKFRVMERSRMNDLLSEQGKARSGLVTTNTPDRTGGFEGVDYLIYGTITSISASSSSDFGSSLLSGLVGGRNASSCNKSNVRLEADIKITDANTGEVRYVTRISELQKGATVCGGPGDIDLSLLFRTAADKIATGLVTTIYPIQVAAVQSDGVVVLNYGEGSIVPETYMSVYEQGEEIRDPATGEVIATNEIYLGTLYITEVQTRFSRAVMAMGFENAAPHIGAVVREASEDEADDAKRAMRKRR
jgi:curli biogenesis system outer membrane secretion channel CsgG